MYFTRFISTFLATLTLIAACASCTANPPPVPRTLPHSVIAARTALRSTVVLLDVNGNPNCAGTFIQANRILTAMHCVRDQTHWVVRAKEVWYLSYDAWQKRSIHPASGGILIHWSEEDDLAMITTPVPNPVWVSIGNDPEIGASVFSIGHPDFNYYTVAAGMLTVRRLPYQGGEYHKVLIAIQGGSSGGGLYDAEWHLIGVASHMNYNGGIGYFATTDASAAWVKG